MSASSISRRRFNQWLTASLLFGHPQLKAGPETESLFVAAIQMTPVLGDLETNLVQSEQLIREAQRKGAEWIILLGNVHLRGGFSSLHAGCDTAHQPQAHADAQTSCTAG